jgi:hypothetical protein
MSHSDLSITEQQKEAFFQAIRPITNVNLTHYIELGVELTRGFERKEFHGTLNGCRIVLPYRGHIYEVLINPIAPIEEVLK